MTELFEHGYALLIGIGESAYPKWSLPVTVKDAQALHSILIDPNFCSYPNDRQHIRLLHDRHSTKNNIFEGLAWLKNCAAEDPEATVIVYYSGHGWLDEDAGQYHLIQHDVEPFDIPNSAIVADFFATALRQIEAKRLLAIFDCCHAQGMATAKENFSDIKLPPHFTQSPLPTTTIEQLKQGEGRAVFASCRGTQKSWIRRDGMLSIYTYHLLQALQGAGNQLGDTQVLVSNLMNYLGQAVPASAKREYHTEQTPFFDLAAEDFPIALLCGGEGMSREERDSAKFGKTGTPAMTENAIAFGSNNTINQGSSNIHIGTARDITLSSPPQPQPPNLNP